MAKMKWCVFVWVCFWVTEISAAGISGLDQLKAFMVSTQAAQGHFTQQQIKVIHKKPVTVNESSGTFTFSRPGKFIWLYERPDEQLLQSDGKKLYLYDKGLNQVTVKELKNTLSASPAAILFGSNQVEERFFVKELAPRNQTAFLEMIPKDDNSLFVSMTIGMKDNLPTQMELRDTLNQTTLIYFSHIKKWPREGKQKSRLDSFEFTPPPGVDVFYSS